MDVEDKVQWVFNAENPQELTERYDLWAKNYEQDLEENFAYVGPQTAVEVFVKYVLKDAKILDAGAGTGLVGQLLASQGYAHLEALDMSTGMLGEAQKKNTYQAFHQATLGQPLDFPSAAFDALISVGTFTVGHAPSSAFDELIRITQPGGYIIFTISNPLYEKDDFPNKLAALEASGRWELIEVTEPFRCHLKHEPDLYLKVWVYRVC